MNKEPLRTGQLDLMILAIIARAPGHGYAIIEELRRRSGGAFDFPEGTIYPVLYRLERAAFLTSDEKIVSGRVRRIYRITRGGREMLRERTRAWGELVEQINNVLAGDGGLSHA